MSTNSLFKNSIAKPPMTEGSVRLEQLRFTLETALENNTPIDVDSVRQDLVDLVLDSTGGAKLRLDEPVPTMDLFKRRDMTEVLAKTPYLALTDVVIYIPRGMQTSFVKAGTVLLDLANQVKDIEADVLTPLVNYTVKLIEKPEDLSRPFPYRVSIDTAELNKRLSEAFKLPSEKVQAKYGDVIDKNLDWSRAADLNKDIQEVLNEDRLNSLIEKHDRVRELSKILDKVLTERKADLQGNAKTINDFVNYTQYVAHVLTFYGHLNAIAISYNTALNDNIERLKKIAD